MSNKTISVPFAFSMEEALKENPELKMSDLQILREWCEKQAHLPKIPDFMLALFLHSNYYLMEPTKSTIENFFTMRTHVPDFFSNRDPLGNKSVRQAMTVASIFPLPEKTPKGQKLYFGRLIDTDPSHYVFTDSLKLFFMIGDLCVFKTGPCKEYMFLGDAEGLSLGHVGRVSPLNLKKFIFYIQEAVPVRLTGVHILNAPAAAEVILNMARPFMKKELLNMIHFHSSLKSLEEFIPVEYLPKEYGGKAESRDVLFEKTKKELEDNRQFFLEEEVWGRVNESLRVGKNMVNDLFGVEGSFKKLDID